MLCDNYEFKYSDIEPGQFIVEEFEKLTIKAKSKLIDPHVRVIGHPDEVSDASRRIRYELQPNNKITMKLDVSWVCHSHIIGKGGNTIQPVVKRTGVSIHFPDGNKNSELHKSNQVSINSRGEEISGLEEARSAIRDLTLLIFTFSLPATAQFISVVDTSLIVIQVQNMYNVQAELQLVNENTLVGSVKGTEWDAARVKEATLRVLQALCGNLANQMTVAMSIEISPQHHPFILGRNTETIRRIMQRTRTTITFPNSHDPLLPPLKRSTITICGAIENVYLARQNIIGSLPLVLMFDILSDQLFDQKDVNQLMQTLDVYIIARNKRNDGRRSVIIKGAERNASNIYEAWRMISKTTKLVPKAKIPPSYNLTNAVELSSYYGIGPCLVNSQECGSYSGAYYENMAPRVNSALECSDLLCNNLAGCEDTYSSPNSSDINGLDCNPLLEINNNVIKCDSSPERGGSVSHSFTMNGQNEVTMEEMDYFLNLIPDRRAPGCEKKHGVVSDYITKRLLASKVMKQPVLPEPRIPTSNWAGYGFSKSQPAFHVNKLIKEEKSNFDKGWHDWNKGNLGGSCSSGITDSCSSEGLASDNVAIAGTCPDTFPNRQRQVDKSASNYIDSVLLRSLHPTMQLKNDVSSILLYIQMEKYIDLFASQDVDFEMFCNLNDQDLKDLGVIIFGHRKKILTTIKKLCLEKISINKFTN